MGFLFLAVYAAESQVLLVSALLPIFVAALAVVSVSISDGILKADSRSFTNTKYRS
jgi:hypothetical protein